jgi:hypothetical protein
MSPPFDFLSIITHYVQISALIDKYPFRRLDGILTSQQNLQEPVGR